MIHPRCCCWIKPLLEWMLDLIVSSEKDATSLSCTTIIKGSFCFCREGIQSVLPYYDLDMLLLFYNQTQQRTITNLESSRQAICTEQREDWKMICLLYLMKATHNCMHKFKPTHTLTQVHAQLRDCLSWRCYPEPISLPLSHTEDTEKCDSSSECKGKAQLG